MSDELPELLGAFDSQLLRRLEGQADTIAELMLARRGVPRPQRWRDEAHPPRGTTEFHLLHTMADDPSVLTVLLHRAVQRQTNREWSVSPLDEALCHTYNYSVGVMLYPAGLDIKNLAEVPPTVLIFQLSTRAPYGISESPPNTPVQIDYRRKNRKADLNNRRSQWQDQRRARREQLLVRLRTELTRQRPTLPVDVARALDDKLSKIMSTPYGGIEPLLEVASYLGVLDRILPEDAPDSAGK